MFEDTKLVLNSEEQEQMIALNPEAFKKKIIEDIEKNITDSAEYIFVEQHQELRSFLWQKQSES